MITTKQSPTHELKSAKVTELVERVWKYMDVSTPISQLPKVPVILVLGSRDMLPAEQAAILYNAGKSDKVLFSGKGGSNLGELGDKTEAFMLRDISMRMGIPERATILEENSTNTGENIRFSHTKLIENKIVVPEMIVVHMPSSLGRDRATLMKQWPTDTENPTPKLYMSGLQVDILEYMIRGFGEKTSSMDIVGSMLGDFQRMQICVAPPRDWMVPVEVHYGSPTPTSIKDAYYELIDRGIGLNSLIRDDAKKPLPI